MSLTFRQIFLLMLAYSVLAGAWAWRLQQPAPQPAVDVAQVEATRAALVARLAKVPMQPKLRLAALLQLAQMPLPEMSELQEWSRAPADQRLRKLTVQQGPVAAPSALVTALVFDEISRDDALSVDEARLLVSASGDRLGEAEKIAVLQQLAARATGEHDDDLALEIHQRIMGSPAVTWQMVHSLVNAARFAHRPAAAQNVVASWIHRLQGEEQQEALDLQSSLLMEGGRHAEASRLALEELRTLGGQEAVPERMLQRALLATREAGEAHDLLPWIERYLASYPEHRLAVADIASGKALSPTYAYWLRESACIADGRNLTTPAVEGYMRLSAAGDFRYLARLHTLATQMGRGADLQRLMAALGQRFSVLEVAKALAESDAPAAARHVLISYLKAHPADRQGRRLLAQLECTLQGEAKAGFVWQVFLRDFPDDAPALRALAAWQVKAGSLTLALRALQSIPEARLEEADLRQLVALAIQLDDMPVAWKAQDRLVKHTPTPALQDVQRLASLTRQHADEASQSALAEAVARLPAAQEVVQKALTLPTHQGEAATFGTAAQSR